MDARVKPARQLYQRLSLGIPAAERLTGRAEKQVLAASGINCRALLRKRIGLPPFLRRRINGAHLRAGIALFDQKARLSAAETHGLRSCTALGIQSKLELLALVQDQDRRAGDGIELLAVIHKDPLRRPLQLDPAQLRAALIDMPQVVSGKFGGHAGEGEPDGAVRPGLEPFDPYVSFSAVYEKAVSGKDHAWFAVPGHAIEEVAGDKRLVQPAGGNVYPPVRISAASGGEAVTDDP